jgi:hypothetical protein
MKYYENNLDGIDVAFSHFDDHYKPKFVQKVQNAGKKALDKIKEAGEKVIDKVKDGDLTALFLPILPFKVAMKKALEKKGIAHSNDLEDIARKFIAMVKNKNNFDSHLTDLEKEAAKETLKDNQKTLAKAGVQIAAGDYAGGAKELVKVIVEYFKNVHDKKDKSEDEKKLLNDAEKGVEDVAGKESEELLPPAPQTPSAPDTSTPASTTTTTPASTMGGLSTTTIAMIVGVIVVLYFVSKK